MKLFVLHPGYVINRNDWSWHSVNSRQLMEFYEVTSEECIVDNEFSSFRIGGISDILHHLYPMSGLDYRPVTDKEREIIKDRLFALGLKPGFYDGDRLRSS